MEKANTAYSFDPSSMYAFSLHLRATTFDLNPVPEAEAEVEAVQAKSVNVG